MRVLPRSAIFYWRRDVSPLTSPQEGLRRQIEHIRSKLYRLYEEQADEEAVLATSRELDRLLIRLMRAQRRSPAQGDGARAVSVGAAGTRDASPQTCTPS